jgi:hypothetical protein
MPLVRMAVSCAGMQKNAAVHYELPLDAAVATILYDTGPRYRALATVWYETARLFGEVVAIAQRSIV